MGRNLKLGIYLLLFGLFATAVLLFSTPKKTTYTPNEVLGANSHLTLFVEPDNGKNWLLELIANSQTIIGEMYLLSDKEILASLVNKNTQLILEQRPYRGNALNKKTKEVLGEAVSWGQPLFNYTHAKFLIFDDKILCIFNANLTNTGFTANREYNVCSTDPQNIAEARNIFLADKNRTRYLAHAPNLIVSPDNSRPKLTAFLQSSQQQIDIAMEVINDERIIELLCQKEASQIEVRLLLPDSKKVDNSTASAKLAGCGAQVKTLKKPYLHAKLITIDRSRAYIGSVNLTATSLDRNREIGILISQANILERLNDVFEQDWRLSD